MALEHLEHKKPALILLDLNMPVMDGFELIDHLQNHEKGCLIPIIVLTAKELTAKELTAKELTAEEQAYLNQHVEIVFHKKPYNQDELILHIHQLIT